MVKKLIISICVISLIGILFFAVNYIFNNYITPSQQMLSNYINDNGTTLLSIASISPNQYIQSEEIDNSKLTYALGFDLIAIDTRGQGIIYYYSWSYSGVETTKYVKYIPDGRLSFGDLILEIPQNENQTMRIDGLGINGEGYIKYHRITDNWYFIEAYLPT